ncbi:MAG: ABC transporter permease [Candidatus Acidiferrum sp.]
MRGSLRRLALRFAALFRRANLDRELEAETAAHLDLAVEENQRNGMTLEEARRLALIQFGGAQQAKETHREARSLAMIETLAQDLRYTLRTLRKDRSFAAIAILILALGIGANIVVFGVVNTLLLRPLPFKDASRLVWLAGNKGEGGLSDVTYRVDAFQGLQRHNESFEQVTAYVPFLAYSDYVLGGSGEPKPVSALHVAGNFFQTLEVQPMLGRLYTADEYAKGGPNAVLLSYAFWRQQYGGDPGVVGRSIVLSQQEYTVVGVMPASFDFASVFSPGSKQDVFLPTVMDDIKDYGHMLSLIGRLKPGITVAQAQAEANTVLPQLRPGGNDSWGTDIVTRMTPLQDYVTGKVRRSLFVLWGAVALILLIVCVNLSNLLLARVASRGKEFAMRSALGASRGRLVRQLLTESVVLSAIGASIGVAIAYAVTFYLAHQGSIALPLLNSIRVDGAALAWTMGITLVVAILFGLAPGLTVSRANPQETLKDAGRGTSECRGHGRMRAVLVVSEVALACVLLVGSGLLLRSFLRVLDVDLGFQPAKALAMRVDYQDGGSPEKRAAIFQEVLHRVSSIPGVQAAGMSDMLPLDRNRSWGLTAKGSIHAGDENTDAFVRVVTPGYIRAMGMHLIEGRDFSWQDSPNSTRVIIVNQTAARRNWPGQSPIGRLAEGVGDKDTTVIGVIADVRQTGVEESVGPEVFVPASQFTPDGADLVVRSNLPGSVLAPTLLQTLRDLNPGQASEELRPIQALVDHAVSPRKFFVYLVGIFAALGLLLAALGIYGVISYSVTRQTQEIGIRMALGATPGRVQQSVLGRTLRLALTGIGVGAVASVAASRLVESLLFKTEAYDPVTFVGVIFVLLGVALLAGYLPALRATRIDPMIALRCE